MFIFTYLRIAKPSFQLTVNSGFRKVDFSGLVNIIIVRRIHFMNTYE